MIDSDGNFVETNYEIVDALKTDFDVEATIFVKKGDDFLRIITGIRDRSGIVFTGRCLAQTVQHIHR